MVALHELRDGDVAHVLVVDAAEQIVEQSLTHGARRGRELVDIELGQNGIQDREPARYHRDAIRPEPCNLHALDAARFDQRAAQLVEPLARDGAFGRRAVCRELGQRAHGAGRADRLLPMLSARISAISGWSSLRAASFRVLHGGPRDDSARKVTLAEAHAAHVKARELVRLEAAADDELGRAAADVDHEPALFRWRQAVLDADENEPRFFASRDHFDREAERDARELQERRRILRHAQRIGADGAHSVTIESAQPFAEAAQRGERALLRRGIEQLVIAEPRAEPTGSRSESSG